MPYVYPSKSLQASASSVLIELFSEKKKHISCKKSYFKWSVVHHVTHIYTSEILSKYNREAQLLRAFCRAIIEVNTILWNFTYTKVAFDVQTIIKMVNI